MTINFNIVEGRGIYSTARDEGMRGIVCAHKDVKEGMCERIEPHGAQGGGPDGRVMVGEAWRGTVMGMAFWLVGPVKRVAASPSSQRPFFVIRMQVGKVNFSMPSLYIL